MDSGDSHNGAPCNVTLRDITNTEGTRTCPPVEEQALTGINHASDRKRKRPLYLGMQIYDKSENEVIHPSKAYEACRHVKGKFLLLNAQQYDSPSSKGNAESQGERLVEELSLRGSSSGQISRFNSETGDSSIGPVASCNIEDEDLSTESDEPNETFGLGKSFLRHPVHPVKDHEKPTISDHSRLDWSFPSKNIADIGEILAHDEKFQNVSLCGSCPCSSCIKAAYMWSDLMYQDTRGRLTALKTSRRHARILEGKILRHEKTGETSQSRCKKAKATESDLLQHWTSLLRCTEDALLCEIVQAQSSLSEIEKLKDKFKRDLETINSIPPQNKSGE